jgi:phospholipid/cholesterol/gamma-HCH transport system permease protein
MSARGAQNIRGWNSYHTEGTTVVELLESVRLSTAHHFSSLHQIAIPETSTTLMLDFSGVEDYDSFVVLIVSRAKALAARHNCSFAYRGETPELRRFIESMSARSAAAAEPEPAEGRLRAFFDTVGSRAIKIAGDVASFFRYIGEVTVGTARALAHPSRIRWADMPLLVFNAGVAAVPIVLLIGFLVGLIIGYQGAMQLKKFGAGMYLADLVGISLTRELAPLMTSIIVAGRSGAAYAAEIGTMKVGEEIDALSSMGFNLTSFLVLPRILTIAMVLPMLTVFADLAGLVGGGMTSVGVLDTTITGFVSRLREALSYEHFFVGVGKSVIFGVLIAAIGCFRGLQVSGGAESVGKSTTSAVVTSIFLIILLDAIFAVLLQVLGI